LTFAAAVLGLHAACFPPEVKAAQLAKAGWSPATSVSQKWAILGSKRLVGVLWGMEWLGCWGSVF
jgi:hypothetical protein